MIVPEQAAKPGSTADAGVRRPRLSGDNQPVVEALVISLVVVVRGELRERLSECPAELSRSQMRT